MQSFSEPLSVLLINKFLYPFGGVERIVFAEKELLESRGHRVILFGMQHPRNVETSWSRYFVSQVDYTDASIGARLRSAARALYSIEARRKLRQLIAHTKPDVAHVHHIYHQITPSILPELYAAGIPVVQTVHDYKPVCPNAKRYVPATGELCFRCKGGRFYHAALMDCGSYGRLSSALIAIEAYVHRIAGTYLRHVRRFLTPSHFLREVLVEGGMPAERVYVLPNFVELNHRRPVYPGRYVLFAGRLETYKGVFQVLEAARRLPQVPFHVVGIGTQEMEVRRAATNLPNVTVRGHLDYAAMQREMQEASCLVAPSLWADIAPQVVLEAFAWGKPVIASSNGGFVEMIVDGRNGYLVDPQNLEMLATRIVQVHTQPPLQEVLGRAARAVAQTRYSPDQHYQSLIAHYHQIKRAAA